MDEKQYDWCFWRGNIFSMYFRIICTNNGTVHQILVVIVIYGIDIIKSLFTRLPGFEMMQDKKYKQYTIKNDLTSQPENVPILEIGKACWDLIASHETVHKRSWNPEIIHKNLLNDLDKIFEELMSRKLNSFLLSANTHWERGRTLSNKI